PASPRRPPVPRARRRTARSTVLLQNSLKAPDLRDQSRHIGSSGSDERGVLWSHEPLDHGRGALRQRIPEQTDDGVQVVAINAAWDMVRVDPIAATVVV